ncbi:ATP-binding protein cassette, sub-family E, member 1 [Trypanosoma theileri]|uniref:ATP-binding protein cassette, sub-family E, member 1 n=1 Tax=Trypanosoma theileri TaxID=67003 RepID=A0A1X0NY81_9TRYP|nr:ATP-binding protein cassette, sub-family E, member 1 [Trypanosoma theileri]ORC89433.1 ATP-binding protein cassette, sub-family E, member 1 [Trypanosoma theileri]
MESKRAPRILTHDEVAEIQEAFCLFDRAGEGYIEMPRVKELMLKLTPGLTEELYLRVVSEAKLENRDTINFPQFFLIISTIPTVLPHNDNYGVDQMADVFAMYDPNRTGHIELNRFLQIMLEEGEPLSQAEGKELMLHLQRFGCLRKGNVSYHKFISKIVKCNSSGMFSRSL